MRKTNLFVRVCTHPIGSTRVIRSIRISNPTNEVHAILEPDTHPKVEVNSCITCACFHSSPLIQASALDRLPREFINSMDLRVRVRLLFVTVLQSSWNSIRINL